MSQAYDICVVGGCGHAGLPLALVLAESGHSVVAYDINQKSVEIVQNKKIPFREKGTEELLRKVLHQNFFVSHDISVLKQSKILMITIGTPVDEHINPQFTPIMKFFQEVEPHITSDHILMMRSTVFPGTCEKIKKFFESKGKNPSICFCPERIAEGQALKELHSIPQIISFFDERGQKACEEVFTPFAPRLIILKPLEAELAKLFTNVWRYVKFAVSNQFFMIANDHDANFSKIGEAMRLDYPRGADFPKAGFTAGPCLFKDTMQLAAFYQHNFFLGHAAMLVNEGMPDYIKKQLKLLPQISGDFSGKTIGILGMAFKPETDDIRESLAFKLKKLLLFEGAQVLCADEYWKGDCLVSKEEIFKKADIIVIGCPHDTYRTLDYSGKTVIDIWESL